MRTLLLVIKLSVPDSMTRKEVLAYVQEAIRHWGGQEAPDDPRRSVYKVNVACLGELK